MKRFPRSAMAVVMMMCLAGAIPAAAQPAGEPGVLTLPVTGTSHGGVEFAGTITINGFEECDTHVRFEECDTHIVAVGFVVGVLSRGGKRSATVVKGEVAWPVVVKSGGEVFALGRPEEMAEPRQVAWSPALPSNFRILPVQAANCPVLDLALGPVNVNLLGLQVALSPVTFNLGGVSGTPLGDLVCEASELLGNVAGLVGVLNSILGLLTGLLGGLVGGLGGAVPVL